jgi:integrase
MNFVEPIRDKKKIAQIKNQLRGQRRYRDLLLFVVGINTALRISDLLQLRIDHFIDDHNRIRQRFWIKEQKRNKRHEVVINQSIREALGEYLEACHSITDEPDNFLFFNTKTNGFSKPIKRGQTWKFIVSICNDVGLRGNYGTHFGLISLQGGFLLNVTLLWRCNHKGQIIALNARLLLGKPFMLKVIEIN